MELEAFGLDDLPEIAKNILTEIDSPSTVIFTGEMGAGKTTLIKELCSTLKVVDPVTSPTYSLVNEYATSNETKVYHFDFYRIDDEFEAVDMGVEEYFDEGVFCFVEWASLIPNLLPESYWEVSIEQQPDNSRKINLINHGE